MNHVVFRQKQRTVVGWLLKNVTHMDSSKVFKGITRLLKVDDVCIDNVVFRLHYKATVTLLLTFALVVTSKEYIGSPIECFSGGESEEKDVINAYCWIFSTYTVREKTSETGVPNSDPGLQHHTGVRGVPYDPSAPNDHLHMIKYHKYYQWIGFILLFQAVLFYIPFYLWNLWEGGRLRLLVSEGAQPVLQMAICEGPLDMQRSITPIVQPLVLYWENHLHHHDCYAFRYVLCEFLNMANVVIQFYLLDHLLGGDFMEYGSALFGKSDFDASEIMERVFPQVAKCSMERYGPSGGIVRKDALCVLSLNVVNAKVFAIEWFWLIILGFLSGATLVYRFLCYVHRNLRISLIRSCTRSVSKSRVKDLLRVYNYSDWFVLYQMAKNMNPLVFSELVHELSRKFAVTHDSQV